jgi:hypothetical protein
MSPSRATWRLRRLTAVGALWSGASLTTGAREMWNLLPPIQIAQSRAQLFVNGAKGPCDSKVIFANLTNGRSWFTFSGKFDDGKSFAYTVSGGHDRQPQIENYYLSIDILRNQIGKVAPTVDNHMEGECHTTFNKMDARDIKCVIYDQSNDGAVTLHLENIADTKRSKGGSHEHDSNFDSHACCTGDGYDVHQFRESLFSSPLLLDRERAELFAQRLRRLCQRPYDAGADCPLS